MSRKSERSRSKMSLPASIPKINKAEVISELRQKTLLAGAPRTSWPRLPIAGFEKEEEYLHLLLRNTVLGDPETGKRSSNSVIVYGAPGVGKTTLVESAIGHMDKVVDGFYDARLVVRLEGLLCPDFKSCVEEICAQLMIRMEPGLGEEDTENEMSAETEEEEMDCFEGIRNAKNFEDRLDQVMEFLRTSMETIKESVIFVLNRLDLFAEHPNQHLLYNLFDIAANVKATVPICIIGVTDRVDVLEMFEKRVKSRFSHRNVCLTPKYEFSDYLGMADRFLKFYEEEDKDESLIPFSAGQIWWNKRVSEVLQSLEVQRVIRVVYETDNTVGKLKTYLFYVLMLVKDDLALMHFEQAYEDHIRRNDLIKLALDLPTTDLVVLLSIYKHVQKNRLQAWQPSSLYRIVEKIMVSYGLHKDDYLRTISKLENYQMIIPVSIAQRSGGGVRSVADIYYRCEISISEFQEIWNSYPTVPSSFKEFL